MTHGRKQHSDYVPGQSRHSENRSRPIENSRTPERDADASLVTASRTALYQLSMLTNRPTEGVSRLEQEDEGWFFQIEIVELDRIPDSTSVLASYETHTDEDGNVVSYKRTRRYTRNQAGEL
jgi:gas vesicle protein GvpO